MIDVPARIPCPICDGTHVLSMECPECEGTGATVVDGAPVQCPACTNGRQPTPCTICDDAGTIENPTKEIYMEADS